jgi:hypothetical protein
MILVGRPGFDFQQDRTSIIFATVFMPVLGHNSLLSNG